MNHNKRWLNRDEAMKYLLANNCQQIGTYKIAFKHEGYDLYKVYKYNLYRFSDRYLYFSKLARYHWWGIDGNLKRVYKKEKLEKELVRVNTKKEKLTKKYNHINKVFENYQQIQCAFGLILPSFIFYSFIFLLKLFFENEFVVRKVDTIGNS